MASAGGGLRQRGGDAADEAALDQALLTVRALLVSTLVCSRPAA